MNWQLSNPEQYSDLWAKESDLLELHGVYSNLSEMTPVGKVLEFGCGVGHGTYHLSAGREVLSLDSNPDLIQKARNRIKTNVAIHQCDFFALTEADRGVIVEFKPQVVVGWFIGGCGTDIMKHTEEEYDVIEKSKIYREKIEDIIVSPSICIGSVEYIHLANRSILSAGFSEAEIFSETKMDYDKYVFKRIGFEVVDVKNMAWPRAGSEFQYGFASNPIFAGGQTAPVIRSILAKRVR